METNSNLPDDYDYYDYDDYIDDYTDDYIDNYIDFPDYVAEQDEFQQKCYEWEEQEYKDNQLEYLNKEVDKLWEVIDELENYLKDNRDVDREDIDKILKKAGNENG